MIEKQSGVYPVKVIIPETTDGQNWNPQDYNISAKEFQDMLDVIQPSGKTIDLLNYVGLLKLARRFDMPGVSKFYFITITSSKLIDWHYCVTVILDLIENPIAADS